MALNHQEILAIAHMLQTAKGCRFESCLSSYGGVPQLVVERSRKPPAVRFGGSNPSASAT